MAPHKHKAVLSVVNDEVSLSVQGNRRACIEVDGSFTGTVVFEAAGHPDGVMQAIQGTQMDGGGTGTSCTAPETYTFDVWGISRLKARCSVISLGSINVWIYAE